MINTDIFKRTGSRTLFFVGSHSKHNLFFEYGCKLIQHAAKMPLIFYKVGKGAYRKKCPPTFFWEMEWRWGWEGVVKSDLRIIFGFFYEKLTRNQAFPPHTNSKCGGGRGKSDLRIIFGCFRKAKTTTCVMGFWRFRVLRVNAERYTQIQNLLKPMSIYVHPLHFLRT